MTAATIAAPQGAEHCGLVLLGGISRSAASARAATLLLLLLLLLLLVQQFPLLQPSPPLLNGERLRVGHARSPRRSDYDLLLALAEPAAIGVAAAAAAATRLSARTGR